MNKDLAVLDLSNNYSPNHRSVVIPDDDGKNGTTTNKGTKPEIAAECKNFVKKLNEEKREREKKK